MKHSKSGLFLMELIIAILFFSLAGTVCIQLFAKSHLLSQETVNQNQAVTWAQNLAEAYLGTEGDMQALLLLFPNGHLEEDGSEFFLCWDINWQDLSSSQAGEAAYTASLQAHGYSAETGLSSADISVRKQSDGQELYSLQIDHHIPERRP